VAACDSSGQPAGDAVVGGIVPFGVAGGIVFILPVAVLWLVECVPNWDVLVVAADDEGCVVEIVVDDSGVCPGAIRVE